MPALKDWTSDWDSFEFGSIPESIRSEFGDAMRSHHAFNTLLSVTDDFIYIKDVNHCFIFASDALARLTNHKSGEELVGKNDFDIFPHEHATIYFNAERPVIEEGKSLHRLEEPYYDHHGHLRWVASTKNPVRNANGKVVGLIGIGKDITELKEREQQLEELSIRDELTQLLNRRALFDFGSKALATAERNQNLAAFLFLDLDNFKSVNDRYGHITGDQVLQLVSKRLQALSRESDYLCRVGGDEFVMLLALEEHNTEGLVHLANRILSIFDEPDLYGCGCSIGIAHTSSVYDLDQLMAAADGAMYKAKKDSDSSVVLTEL